MQSYTLKLSCNQQISAAISAVLRIRKAGYAAYFVGGAVRDLLLGKIPKDIDIATAARPEVIETLFPGYHRIGASFGVVLVGIDGFQFEIASFRTEGEYRDGRHPANLNYTESPETDAARRDFTVNAFYLDPQSGTVLDFFGGLEDLRQGQLRTVGAPQARFREDYLRMLRAVRFAVRLRFRMHSALREAIPPLAHRITTLSAERIREELNGMLCSGNPTKAIRLLDELALLPHCLPEVSAMKGVEQHPLYHPEGDVFVHTLKVMDQLDAPDRITVWAALLHDIGKPRTRTVDGEGVPHFYGHEAVGAKMADALLLRLKFDSKTREAIVQTVASHMRFVQVAQIKTPKLRRWIADPCFPQELALLRADCLGSHGGLEPWLYLIDRAREFADDPGLPVPVITGYDVLSAGIPKGRLVGEILKRIFNRQLGGKIITREEALNYLRRFSQKIGQ